jgi:hypothetical protein
MPQVCIEKRQPWIKYLAVARACPQYLVGAHLEPASPAVINAARDEDDDISLIPELDTKS